jgi:hypothetical protein
VAISTGSLAKRRVRKGVVNLNSPKTNFLQLTALVNWDNLQVLHCCLDFGMAQDLKQDKNIALLTQPIDSKRMAELVRAASQPLLCDLESPLARDRKHAVIGFQGAHIDLQDR